jgi:hypothetical protein
MANRKLLSTEFAEFGYGSDEENVREQTTSVTLLSPNMRREEVKRSSSSSAGVGKSSIKTPGSGLCGGASSSSCGGRARSATFGSAKKQVSFMGTQDTPMTTMGAEKIKPQAGKQRDSGSGVSSFHQDSSTGRTSSSFELAEKAASKVIVDSVQFQLDGLFSKNATPALRRRCAWKLFQLCQTNANNMTLFRSNSVIHPLLRVLGLLLTEQDSTVEAILVGLAVLLVQGSNKRTPSSFNLPVSSIQALVICSLDTKTEIRQVIYESVFGHLPPRNLALTAESSEDNMQPSNTAASSESSSCSKRRFKRKRSGGEGERSEDTGREVDSGGSLVHDDVPVDVPSKLMELWPQLFQVLLPSRDGASITADDTVVKTLSLSIVTGVLVGNAQLCASTNCTSDILTDSSPQSKGGKNSSIESLRQCQRALGQKPVHTKIDGESGCRLSYIQLYAVQFMNCVCHQESPSYQIWQLLSVLDASCYRDAANQRLLAKPVNIDGHERYLPKELLAYLFRLAPVVMSAVKSEVETSPTKEHTTKNANEDTTPSASVRNDLCDLFFPELNLRQGRVDESDLFVVALKTLVNMTHSCEAAASIVLWDDIAPSLLTILSYFNDQLCFLREKDMRDDRDDTATGLDGSPRLRGMKGVLSPDETRVERLIYDIMLQLLALVTNLVDNASEERRRSFVGLSHAACYSVHPKVMNEDGLLDTYVGDNQFLLSVAIRVMNSSSASFMGDMEETEPRVPEVSSSSSSSTATLNVPVGESKEPADKGDKIPVADIILASQASMLLFVMGCADRPKVGSMMDTENFLCMSDANSVTDIVSSPSALNESASIRNALIHKSWWLQIRVLKAFLALQNSTGVFLYDNLLPALEAIRVMELQDVASARAGDATATPAVITPFPIAHAQPRDEGSAPSVNEDNWLSSSQIVPPQQREPFADDTISSFPAASGWKWNGTDLVEESSTEILVGGDSSSADFVSPQQQSSTEFKAVSTVDWLTSGNLKRFGGEKNKDRTTMNE